MSFCTFFIALPAVFAPLTSPLVELVNAFLDFFDGDTEFFGEIQLRLLGVGQEFVQRRVEEANGGREALERFSKLCREENTPLHRSFTERIKDFLEQL
ncbi:MAG: hypothetical protein WCO92_02765 [Verrucomicrobiota bacterium]